MNKRKTTEVITYWSHDNGSVLLIFLFSESILQVNTKDLAVLADINSGVMKLEVDEVVIDSIQQYSIVKRSTRATGLEYSLNQRTAEINSDRQ